MNSFKKKKKSYFNLAQELDRKDFTSEIPLICHANLMKASSVGHGFALDSITNQLLFFCDENKKSNCR